MDEIIKRYGGAKTFRGYELQVDEYRSGVIIWYLFWGEYAGVDGHHHMGIACIRAIENAFEIGWLSGTDQSPHRTERIMDLNELFAKIDTEIKNR